MEEYDKKRFNMNLMFRENYNRVIYISNLLDNYTFSNNLYYLSRQYEAFKRMHGEFIACDNIERCIIELHNICLIISNSEVNIQLKEYYDEIENIKNILKSLLSIP